LERESGAADFRVMQSNGGSISAAQARREAVRCVLSGPAGGVVGARTVAQAAGFDDLLTFDMGGTSTDVSHYDGAFERAFETQVAGVRMRAPMMRIHTVAAGGGSILRFENGRFQTGPDSAGADPGPACYRKGGPLAVTDCNVMLGKVQPGHFPKVFGPGADQPLDRQASAAQFTVLADQITRETGSPITPEAVAEGFLRIAVENMANAIKEISVQRGYDVTEYTLCTFGGAGGQHACLVADTLGMNRIHMHPLAGVLSAYGMGLADIRSLREQAAELPLTLEALRHLGDRLDILAKEARTELLTQGVAGGAIAETRRLHLRYDGTDTALPIDLKDLPAIQADFAAEHERLFGFVIPERALVVESVSVECAGGVGAAEEREFPLSTDPLGPPLERVSVYLDGDWQDTPIYDRADLAPGHRVDGPALIIEPVATVVVEPGWRAEVNALSHLFLTRVAPRPARRAIGTEADPIMLEVFNNLFMSIAEQMGATLANTAQSVNIKERLDFSCALFDGDGNLVANAPHMPVHLGSMGESVRTILAARTGSMKPGQVYVLNAPYNGGTHLPDVTVVSPVFVGASEAPLFFVASRGHHADIGGITPGSMPPHSTSVEEEGVLLDNVLLVEDGALQEAALREILAAGPYPARNPDRNIADLKAQLAANAKGARELLRMVDHFSLPVVRAYMGHVQDNAEESVRRVLDVLKDGRFTYPMDDGSEVKVAISIDREAREATVDFTGSSAQQANNFNAPSAVCRAAVLYVFRTLVDDAIPLNEGCLKPLRIIIPEGSMLSPRYPAAVVAGNVETSQAVVDALYGALGVMAAAQGTMNNLTFGNATHQYYETICGGSGAGPGFNGTDAVHTHMTNSRLTDPEVLEWRYPVLLEEFSIRRGSGGAGKFKGGNGVVRRIRFNEAMTVAILSGHRIVPPYGMAGGAPGKVGENRIIRADGSIDPLPGTVGAEVEPGDAVILETPGGGGFGTP
ncbi:MAG: hydantoinase B/oxoprolinase family protein, partial [Magnetospiraceae bacterium]